MPSSSVLRWTTLGAVAITLPALRPSQPVTRYRIDQSLAQEVDGSAAGQGRDSLRFSAVSFVTVTLADSAGGRTMRVVVDSMRGDSTSPIPAAVFDSARGAVYGTFVSRDGRPGQLRAASPTSASLQVQGLLADFFPWVRAGLRAGQAWADTTVVSTGTGPDSVTVRRVTNYRAGTAAGRQPRNSLRVATDYTSEVAGSQPTPNGPARIEGTGTGKGSYLVSSDGHYLGGEWELSSSLRLTADFTPKPVPIALRQTIRVSTIK
jgi:hypothetical protein